MRNAKVIKPHPHLYANAKQTRKRIMWTCRRTAFAYAAYVRRTGERCLSGVDTSKKNTFAIIPMWTYIHSGNQQMTSGMLVRLLVRQTLNKQLFGIRSHLPRSHMPCSQSRIDVDTPLNSKVCSIKTHPAVHDVTEWPFSWFILRLYGFDTKFRAQQFQKYASHTKKLQIKVVRNWISYKKVPQHRCLSPLQKWS